MAADCGEDVVPKSAGRFVGLWRREAGRDGTKGLGVASRVSLAAARGELEEQERVLEAGERGKEPVLRRDPVRLVPHETEIAQDELGEVLPEVAEEEQSVGGDRVQRPAARRRESASALPSTRSGGHALRQRSTSSGRRID